ncbi:MAG: sugar phosphate nucleotidyltransferase [Parachlamydiaceae bacterium]
MIQKTRISGIVHILLCGGVGTRLWPLSRALKPKQFIPLFDQLSLFQKTVVGNRQYTSDLIVVCNSDHRDLAQQQLDACDCEAKNYILEPSGRNTSAAIALALLTASPEDIVLVTPCDHQIDYSEAYCQSIRQAECLAQEGHIVIFGIVPHSPETGYGYIEACGENVSKFHEKPNLETALQYIIDGSYFWNSGMLCFQVKTLLNTMKVIAPDIFQSAMAALETASWDGNCIHIGSEEMNRIPSISIDYSVLEKIQGLKMVTCGFRWSDLGSFDSLFFHLQKDNHGNALDVKGFYGVNAKNNLMISKDRIITAIDIEDLVVIDTKDALLIAKSGSTQKVREIVNLLEVAGAEIHL